MTVLFADMVESTALGERLDPEALRAIQERYFTALREVVERHGGVVEKYIGDAVMAVFGVPAAHEDDALRAVRAASELSAALSSLSNDLERRRGVRLELRTGVNSGPVITTDGDGAGTLVTGDTVNAAARLQQGASPGEIVLGATTYDLVRDAVTADELEPLALKGKSTVVRAYRLTAVTGTEGRARRSDTPLVGRTSEIELLESSLARAIEDRAPQLVTVLGTAGVGKSRLVRDFAGSLADRAVVVRGRCLSYGDGITYWPIVEILRAAAGILETDEAAVIDARLVELIKGAAKADRLTSVLAAILGASDEGAVGDDVSWAVRRAFELMARRRPLVLIVEDIHWAEPALLDLLEAVVDWTSDAPLLLVCLARPELLEMRPAWGAQSRATTVDLEPLGSSVAKDLLASLPGGDAIPATGRDRVLAVAEGNPLYLEECVAKFIDDGALVERDQGWSWTGDTELTELPATVQALVAARIDGLPRVEQRVAERASVVGRVFERGAVAALGSDGAPGSVGGSLLALVRKQLIRPEMGGLDGDDAFRFRHIILRDVAYERMPKAVRAVLHERCADWLESVLGDRVAEYVEIVAHHLAEAVAYRIELDTLDGPGSQGLVARAVARLVEAAGRAERLHAYGQAARLYGRAASINRGAGSVDGTRDLSAVIDLEISAADADALGGELEAAAQRAQRVADDPDLVDPSQRGRVLERLAAFRWNVGDDTGAMAAIEEADRLVPATVSLDRARVLAGHARLLMLVMRYEDAVLLCHAALDAADALGAPTVRVSALVTLGLCLGSLDRVTEGVALLEEARDLATEIGDGPGFVRAAGNLPLIFRDRDQAEAEMIETIDRLYDLGLERSFSGVNLQLNLALTMTDSGRLGEAQRALDRVLALEPTGARFASVMGEQGRILCLQGRYTEARGALAVARDSANRGRSRNAYTELFWVEAFEALLEGRYDDAWGLVAEGLTTADDPANLLEYEWLKLQIGAELAIRARSVADAKEEREWLDAARRSVARVRDLATSVNLAREWPQRHSLPLLAAELTRAEGASDGALWQAAAAELRADRFLWDEAYALYRHAEALLDSGAPQVDVARALETATKAAEGIGAGGIVAWVEELRARRAAGGR